MLHGMLARIRATLRGPHRARVRWGAPHRACELAFVATLAALIAFGPALASQNNLWSPTTGTVSGLNLTNNYNNALDSLNTCNSGASAPANQLSGAPSAGNCWLDTSVSPNRLKVYDGTSWVIAAILDPTNHFWVPVTGGGTVQAIASAATTDLCSANQNFPTYVSITGTTTITAFGSNCQTGQIKVGVFTGVLTLTHNATSLILPNNGSNITTAVGDTFIAVHLGSGNWRVLSYILANGTAVNTAVSFGSHGDANVTIASTERDIVTSAALTLARTWTLPAANSVSAGTQLVISDEANGITATNTLTIARAGTDTIVAQGATVTSIVLQNAGASLTLISDGSSKWIKPASVMGPQCSTFTSGTAATDTIPTGALYIRVRMVGGGGGGGAEATNSGAVGADTKYDTSNWTAIHGNGGGTGLGTGGAGGTGGVNGTGTVIARVSGAQGQGGGTTNTVGGDGGSSPFGGAGAGQIGTGGAAAANSGSGGAGAGGTGGLNSAAGGGAGEFVEFMITSPAASYVYTVGTGGNGGAAGTTAGGNGAAGRIERCAYFQ